jgi:hypothetical protein
MAELVGFVSSGSGLGPDPELIEAIFDRAGERAPGHGVAWIRGEGGLRLSVGPERLGFAAGLLAELRPAALIAHAGEPCQPLVADGVALAHVGTVGNLDEITERYDVRLSTHLPGEVILRLMEGLFGSLAARVEWSISKLGHGAPLGLLGLTAEGELVAARRPADDGRPGFPLFLWKRPEGTYVSSRPPAGEWLAVIDDVIVPWTVG